ncbi:MAG TPA: hypothetical protein V6D29_00295 [Leptolyngbyaceae cyanobacterium]
MKIQWKKVVWIVVPGAIAIAGLGLYASYQALLPRCMIVRSNNEVELVKGKACQTVEIEPGDWVID